MMKGEDCFKQNKSTLKDVSYDDKNKVYMTESTIPVYDFDGIKDWYWDNIIKSREKGSSNDALWVDGERMIFIEFKNGNFQLFAKNGLARKLYESLFMLFDENMPVTSICRQFRPSINYTRTNMEYILVYNGDKIPTEKHGRLAIAGSLNKLAKFGLGFYEGFLFAKVRTYTAEEFEKYFVSTICGSND